LLDDTLQLTIDTYLIAQGPNNAGIDFAGPYLVSPRKDDDSLRTAKDVPGNSVCTVEDTTGGGTDIPGAHMDGQQPNMQGCVAQSAAGNTDAVSDWLTFDGYMHLHLDDYQVVLPGVFGQLQYFGIGLEKGHHADCRKFNGVSKNFLDKQWATDFLTDFPDAVKDYNQQTGGARDFQSVFKPTTNEMQRLSCKW
jgi:glutamate transport system substrate-binding protein